MAIAAGQKDGWGLEGGARGGDKRMYRANAGLANTAHRLLA